MEIEETVLRQVKGKYNSDVGRKVKEWVMDYSTREYEVEITVYYDSARNKLTYELVKDGETVDADEPFVFTNVYRPGVPGKPVDPYDPPYNPPHDPYEPSSPKTGDAGVGIWITMLVVSALGFAVTVLVMCKRRRA